MTSTEDASGVVDLHAVDIDGAVGFCGVVLLSCCLGHFSDLVTMSGAEVLDRQSISLPGIQEPFASQVLALNKRTSLIVLVHGL